MAETADFLVIGGGVAGLSSAARLARHGRVVIVEAEEAPGYHSSGRSVSFSHFGIGGPAVRGLTAYSRSFFEATLSEAESLCHRALSIYAADEANLGRLDELGEAMSAHTDAIEPLDEAGIRTLCPVVRTGPGAAVRGLLDCSGLKLETAAMLQHFLRQVRGHGGILHTGKRIAAVEREGEGWCVMSESGETWSAPILINAAGAWADQVAKLASVAPIGLQPKRRTIIVVDPPSGMDVTSWPFVHSMAGDFYMLAEAGQLLVSPVDEVESDPCDAQPEEYDAAFAADRLEHYTTLKVTRISHRWAGLRSFVADRVPTAGFAPDAPGFFWLVGQGGYGLQTAPAMAEIAEALIMDKAWPEGLAEHGVMPDQIRPERLSRNAIPSAAN